MATPSNGWTSHMALLCPTRFEEFIYYCTFISYKPPALSGLKKEWESDFLDFYPIFTYMMNTETRRLPASRSRSPMWTRRTRIKPAYLLSSMSDTPNFCSALTMFQIPALVHHSHSLWNHLSAWDKKQRFQNKLGISLMQIFITSI